MISRSHPVQVERIARRDRVDADDVVAIEEPLEIRIAHASLPPPGAASISITMRTPGDDIDLAIGFLFGEGIIDGSAAIVSAQHCGPPAPDSGLRNIVRIELDAGIALDIEQLKRHFYTTSSCGVCGKSSLEALSLAAAQPLAGDGTRFEAGMLAQLPAALRSAQEVFATTGGLHAAALFRPTGELVVVREDVGRHNAVDKVVGDRLAAAAVPAQGHGMLVSGRASFELMQKTLRAGVPLLAAVGAPSSLAVAVARRFGMTLVGFLRAGRCNIYAGGERVV